MSNVVQFPDKDKIEEQACDWVARLDSGSITEQEVAALQNWLQADPQHASVLMEMAELMDRMTVLSKLSKLFPLEELAPEYGVQQTSKGWVSGAWKPFAGFAGVAAALMVVVLIVEDFSIDSFLGRPSHDVVTTQVGGLKQITLDDGSTVTLNTKSSIDVDFSARERKVILEYGEALFQVAHDESRPFYVVANGNVVRAVGTAFNVEIGSAGVEVVVTEGVVEIAPSSAQDVNSSVLATNQEKNQSGSKVLKPIRVEAGQLAVINHTLEEFHPVDTELIAAKLAWQRGELVFQGEALYQVVAEVSRYTDQSLIIADSRIRDIKVGGRFTAGDIENLLDILDHGFNIEATRTDNGMVFLASRE